MIANLKPYPVMKASDVPWIGKVPNHWTRLPGRACYREEKVLNKGLTENTVLSLSYGQIVVKPPEKLHGLVPASFETYQIVEPGDIIVRPTDLQNDWNSLRFGLSRDRGVITSAYMCLYTEEAVTRPYGHLLLHTYDLKKVFYGLGSGLRQNLDWRDFKYLPCIVPPLPEQAAIVRYLDHAERRIRRYIRAKQKLIKLLEEQKQAIIHQTVTGQVDVRTGRPYPAYKPSGVEWLGDVPAHWTTARLKSSMNNIVEQTTERRGSDLYVALEHVESWTGRLRHAGPDISFDSQVKYFRSGDILFGKLRPYLAKVTRPASDGVCVGEFLVLRPRHSNATAPYMEQLLRSKPFIDAVNSSTFGAKMPRADWQFMGGMAIVYPPLPEQATIVRYLDEAAVDIDDTVNRTRRQIELLSEYRTRLIADVVTGKLDVREAAAGLPDEVEEPEPFDETGALINGEEEPSDGLDTAPEEAAV